MGVKLEPSPLRLSTLHSGSSPALPPSARGRSIFGKYLNTHLKFMVYGHKQASTYVNTIPQCSPTSVGLAQAHPNKHNLRLSAHLACMIMHLRLRHSATAHCTSTCASMFFLLTQLCCMHADKLVPVNLCLLFSACVNT